MIIGRASTRGDGEKEGVREKAAGLVVNIWWLGRPGLDIQEK